MNHNNSRIMNRNSYFVYEDLIATASNRSRKQRYSTTTFIYTPQNNLRATSFIFPLIITKMRPLSFKIISWAKLDVSALFQSAQHVRNMFSYKSVNGTNNARPKVSKKNGNFQKTSFIPKWSFFFHITRKILCLMKTIFCHTQTHANSTFLRVKGTLIWPVKEANPLRGWKCLESFP